MMQFEESPTAVMSASGEQETLSVSDLSRCRSCGTTLARDQRYCLNCGKTAAERPAAPQQQAPAAAAVAPAATATGITPGVAAAGVCLSVLFLAAGVLVGRNSGASQQKAAPAAAPIVVQSTGGGSGTASTDTATDATPTDTGTGASAAAPTASAPPPKLTAADKAKSQKAAQQLNNLDKLSGKDYSKASAKLPKQYVAPGKLPPPDGGQAGGGSSATTIG